MSASKTNARSAAWFILVGAVTAAIYFMLAAFLLEVIRLDYRIGVTASYLVAAGFHFFMNRHITFQSSGRDLFSQALRYAAIALLNYLITLATVVIVVEMVGVNPYIGVALSIVITVVFGYLACRVWVFRQGIQAHG